MSDVESRQYKIYFTPRVSEFVYGDEIEVSASIVSTGVNTMKKSIDSGDFEVGVFVYGDVTLKAINKDGYLGTEKDGRSIFTYSRDKTKVRIDFVDNEGSSTRFKGIINEEATKEDFEKEELTFRVLSLDSVLRTERISGGLISSGITATAAFASMLNRTKITSVLNYSLANITPNVDITIDDGSKFDNQTTREALNDLLLATNSVLLIDSSDNMLVKSRENSTIANATVLYGPYDLQNRQNIISVKKYNTGMHRTFTSVDVDSTTYTDLPHALDYGYRQKRVSFDFITDTDTRSTIAQSLVNEFRIPKLEFEVELTTSVAKNINLLDNISVDYPLRVKRYSESTFLPVVGQTKIADSEMVLPYVFGNNQIFGEAAFKVIEISENPKNFITTLKLRQTTAGWLTDSGSCLVGYARVGEAEICGSGTACDSYEVALIGGAKIGCTLTI